MRDAIGHERLWPDALCAGFILAGLSNAARSRGPASAAGGLRRALRTSLDVMEDLGLALLGALVPLLCLGAVYVVIRQAVLSALIKHTNLVRQQDADAAEQLELRAP